MLPSSQDVDMYDASTDTPALARNSNLNEELGQVRLSLHVFSFPSVCPRTLDHTPSSAASPHTAHSIGEVHLLRQDWDTDRECDGIQEVHSSRTNIQVC